MILSPISGPRLISLPSPKASTVTRVLLLTFLEIHSCVRQRMFCVYKDIFIKMIACCGEHCYFHLLYLGDYSISYGATLFLSAA